MSKAPKAQLVEQEDSKASNENAPKLFSKWSFDIGVLSAVLFRLKTHASLTTSQSKPLNPEFTSLTLQADTKPKSSEKLFAQ